MLRVFSRKLCSMWTPEKYKRNVLDGAVTLCVNPKKSGVPYEYFYLSTECRKKGMNPRELFTPSEMKWFVEIFEEGIPNLDDHFTRMSTLSCEIGAIIRAYRSGIEFLEEDIIKHEKSLQLPWRELKCGQGIWDMNDTLNLYMYLEPEFPNPFANDLRAVPQSHCWFRDWEFKESEKEFGKNVYPDDLKFKPIDPSIAVSVENITFLEFASKCPPLGVEEDVKALLAYFSYSQACRNFSQHPYALFQYEFLRLGDWPLFFGRIEAVVHHALGTKEFSKIKVIRSAIEFLEEEIVANLVETQAVYGQFKESEAFSKLDDLVKEQNQDLPKYSSDLRSVPLSHTWWTASERITSIQKFPKGGNATLAPFKPYEIDDLKENMLCCLLKFVNSQNQTSGLGFFEYFHAFASEALKYQKDPITFLSDDEIDEIQKQLRLALPMFSKLASDLPQEEKEDFLCVCSGMDLLEEHFIGRNPDLQQLWTEFVVNTGVQENISKMLNE